MEEDWEPFEVREAEEVKTLCLPGGTRDSHVRVEADKIGKILEAIRRGWNVDIVYADIQGKLDIQAIAGKLEKNSKGKLTISGNISICGSSIKEKVSFSGSQFSMGANFYASQFNRDTYFDSTDFEGDAKFDFATFNEDAHFGYARFSGNAFFWSATFGGDAYLKSTLFSGNAYFSYTQFKEDAYFESAQFRGDAYLDGVHFQKGAIFGHQSQQRLKGRGGERDNRATTKRFLQELPATSDRKIARIVGCDPKVVSQIRKLLLDSGELHKHEVYEDNAQ